MEKPFDHLWAIHLLFVWQGIKVKQVPLILALMSKHTDTQQVKAVMYVVPLI